MEAGCLPVMDAHISQLAELQHQCACLCQQKLNFFLAVLPKSHHVLLQMLMVLFDILVSHRRMSRWHEKRIQAHLRDQQATQHAKQELQQRLESNAQASTSQASETQTPNGQASASQPEASRQAPGNEEPAEPTGKIGSGAAANGNVSLLNAFDLCGSCACSCGCVMLLVQHAFTAFCPSFFVDSLFLSLSLIWESACPLLSHIDWAVPMVWLGTNGVHNMTNIVVHP